MNQYLYGADVQGIQSYIFETNKLREIGGASELIERICGPLLRKHFEQSGLAYRKEQTLRAAAGSIRYVFTNRESCQKFVRGFEKRVYEAVPGITLSQAVVPVASTLRDADREVNQRLRQARIMASPLPNLGWMISERSRRTGRTGINWDQAKAVIDQRQEAKRKANPKEAHTKLYEKLLGKNSGYQNQEIPHDLIDITQNEDRRFLAVVHADGSGIGKLIQQLLDSDNGKNTNDQRSLEKYREFSETLEEATVAAVRTAFDCDIRPDFEKRLEEDPNRKHRLPIRPVIIGGDDVTFIMDARYALEFTQTYLREFERETKQRFLAYGKKYGVQKLFQQGLTAGAGVAFVKPKFPFHYAIHLAENLCNWTKNIAKEIDSDRPASGLHFHKVQSSFVKPYSDILREELTDLQNRRLTAGPYFLDPPDGYYSVDELLKWTKYLRREESPTGPLRNYLGELRENTAAAEQSLERIQQVNTSEVVRSLNLGDLFQTRDKQQLTYLGDALALQNL